MALATNGGYISLESAEVDSGHIELIHTLRLLARSHKRFTEEQKTKVFRSIVKEARLTSSGVELEMYSQPTQNVWWKYRQKKTVHVARPSLPGIQTVRIRTAQQKSLQR